MFQFIITNVLMISVGAVLFILVRALPRLGEESSEVKMSILERWVASELPEKIDKTLNSFLEKFLRKSHVWLLKVDNNVSHWLKRVRPNSNGTKAGFDFKDIASKDSDTESK